MRVIEVRKSQPKPVIEGIQIELTAEEAAGLIGTFGPLPSALTVEADGEKARVDFYPLYRELCRALTGSPLLVPSGGTLGAVYHAAKQQVRQAKGVA